MRTIITLAFSAALLAGTSLMAPAAHAQAAPDAAAPAADAPAAPAADAPAKPAKKHHKSMAKASKPTKSDTAVDDLNEKSLAAAKDGKSFAPPTTPTPAKAAAKPMAHKHHMKKPAPKADAPAADAPAPDAPK